MHLPSVIIPVFISWLLSPLHDSTDATVTGISLEGCFKNLSHYTNVRNLSDKNGPRHCFDECNNTEYIGLQKKDCFCNVTRGAYATERDCSFSCPGERSFSCGSVNTIYVYYKEQTNISVYGEFGFIFLHLYKPDVHYRYGINGTTNIAEKLRYICYDEPSKCDFKAVGTEMTWLEAKADCLLHNKGLVPYRIAIDETICTTSLPGGYFWIGMSWFNPVSTTTISTTSMIITKTQRTTTMRGTTIMATVRSTTSTNIKSESVTLYSTTPVKHTLSDDKTSTPTAVFVIIPVLLVATVVSVVILYKKKLMCFKNRDGVDESIMTTQLEIPSIDPLSTITTTTNTAPGSTIVRLRN